MVEWDSMDKTDVLAAKGVELPGRDERTVFVVHQGQ